MNEKDPTRLGIEMATDYRQGNYVKVGYDMTTNGLMHGIGWVGSRFAPGPTGAAFNLMLTPFNQALGYGSRKLTPSNQGK